MTGIMYETFFGLQRAPFSVAPDPRFMYMSPMHRLAHSHLKYGLLRGSGFVLLTGEVGAGKTTVWRSFLKRLPPTIDVAYVVNPKLDANALLARVCDDLRIAHAPGTVDLIDAIHGHVLLAAAQGRRTLIVVDEAQALSFGVLEQLRLLTNLDATGGKLQVLLIGQPELRTMLHHPTLEPVAQRVVARLHLPALAEGETSRYIAHRLYVAGYAGGSPFDALALEKIHEICGGVPRRINVLCDRAMFLAHAANTLSIGAPLIDQAALEAFGTLPDASAPSTLPVAAVPSSEPALPETPAHRRWRPLTMAGVAGAMLAAAVLLLIDHLRHATPVAVSIPRPFAASPATPPGAALATDAPALVATTTPVAAPAVTPESAVQTAPEPQAASPVTAAGGATTAHRDSVAGTVPIETMIDESVALRKLALLWKQALDPGQPCISAIQAGLRCFRSTGGLGLVRMLDRPSLLRLVDDQGHVRNALLVGLADGSAIFQDDNGEQVMPLAELARHWRGEFTTFWRAPPQYRDGDFRYNAVALAPWLQQQLNRVAAAGSPQANGDPLGARIRDFQLAQGLTPDGVPGPMTLMLLNRASGVDEPRLQVAR